MFVLVLSALTVRAQVTCPAAPSKGGNCWTTEDVIDGHIDHHAQSAMLWMFGRGGQAAAHASVLLCAVKTRQLEGIYLPDQGVPALRSQPFGGWWTIIPAGLRSTCYKKPSGKTPLIAFRRQIKDNKDQVSGALVDAFKGCGIPRTLPRCYLATISKPRVVECRITRDCYVKPPDRDLDLDHYWSCEHGRCVQRPW